MSERLFVCVQVETISALSVQDGRYVLRERPGAPPDHVLVLATKRSRDDRPEATVATVIDPVSLTARSQAQRWLSELDVERETALALAVLDRVRAAHRIATADPDVHALWPAHTLAVRAGWGTGANVADGRFDEQRELPRDALHAKQGSARRLLRKALPTTRARRGALRADERFAALIGGRTRALLCEELALRARHDLDRGDLRLAALELERAYAAALVELSAEQAAVLSERLAELHTLNDSVRAASASALAPEGSGPVPGPGSGPESGSAPGWIDSLPNQEVIDVITHALGRLEAALRARVAAGAYGAG